MKIPSLICLICFKCLNKSMGMGQNIDSIWIRFRSHSIYHVWLYIYMYNWDTCIKFETLVMEGVTTPPSLVMLLQHQNFLACSSEQSPNTKSPNTTPNDDGIQMLWDFVTFKSYKRLCFVPPKNCQLKAMTWNERIRCKTGTVITLCIL